MMFGGISGCGLDRISGCGLEGVSGCDLEDISGHVPRGYQHVRFRGHQLVQF